MTSGGVEGAPFEIEFVGLMDEAIKDRVDYGGIGQIGVPMLDRQHPTLFHSEIANILWKYVRFGDPAQKAALARSWKAAPTRYTRVFDSGLL